MRRIIIPARYDSSRFSGKLLQEIGNIPIIVHTYQRALAAAVDSVIVATDDERIAEAVQAAGAEVLLSTTIHHSGTERISEVVRQLDYADDDIIINLQGDEPFVPPKLLQQTAADLQQHQQASVATVYLPLEEVTDVFNPNVVKVVLDKQNYALYFSRAPIPWLSSVFKSNVQDRFSATDDFDLSLFHRHIGIYAYRASFVKYYNELACSPLEQQESLEQLRVLWNGYKIILSQANSILPQEINTPQDLQKARDYFTRNIKSVMT